MLLGEGGIANYRGGRGLEIEKLAMRLGGRGVWWGCRDWEVNHRLGQVLVERDVPVGVVLFREGFEPEGLQLVEGGEALAWGVFVAGVAEGAEVVGVLVTGQPVVVGHRGVKRGTDGPAGIVKSHWQ